MSSCGWSPFNIETSKQHFLYTLPRLYSTEHSGQYYHCKLSVLSDGRTEPDVQLHGLLEINYSLRLTSCTWKVIARSSLQLAMWIKTLPCGLPCSLPHWLTHNILLADSSLSWLNAGGGSLGRHHNRLGGGGGGGSMCDTFIFQDYIS